MNGKLQTIPKAEISEINLKDPKKEVITTKPPVHHTDPITTQLSWQDTRWAITGRSAILPGWGQWKVGQKRWAIISFLLFAGAALYANNCKEKAITEENDYRFNSTAITIAAFADPNLNPISSDETVRTTALITRILTTATATNPYFNSYRSCYLSIQSSSMAVRRYLRITVDTYLYWLKIIKSYRPYFQIQIRKDGNFQPLWLEIR